MPELNKKQINHRDKAGKNKRENEKELDERGEEQENMRKNETQREITRRNEK